MQTRFVMAVDEEGEEKSVAADSALRLLCADCSALLQGNIDDDEWKRRTNFCSG